MTNYGRGMSIVAKADRVDGRTEFSGCPEGFDAFVLATAIRERAETGLFIARDDRRAEAMKSSLAFFAPEIRVMDFPAWDCLPFDRISPRPAISAQRMKVLSELVHELEDPAVLITTASAFGQRVPPGEAIAAWCFSANVGSPINYAQLLEYFMHMGFSRAQSVTEPGDYAIRGGLIDVFLPGYDNPLRLDFIGDTLDSIRMFDAESQLSKGTVDRVDFVPPSEVCLGEGYVRCFRKKYRQVFGVAGSDHLYGAVSEGRKILGIEHWMPLFHENLVTLLDYLPGSPVFLDNRFFETCESRWETVVNQYRAREDAFGERSQLDSRYRPCPPEYLYLDRSRISACLAERDVSTLSEAGAARGDGTAWGGCAGRDFSRERQSDATSVFEAFAGHIRDKSGDGDVIIACHSSGSLERMADLLVEYDLNESVVVRNCRDLKTVKGKTGLCIWGLEHGFEAPGLTVISEKDVFGERVVRATRRHRNKPARLLIEANNLSEGDLVVHEEHGIGRFKCLEVLSVDGNAHECLHIEYADKGRLFLPVENLDLISRYGQGETSLDRLGSLAWQERKAGSKKRIRELARQLLKVAAAREIHESPVLEPELEGWAEFCARFPHPETDDQLEAIDVILREMATGRPMDRLVCGDVGFGKTEVAVRAAYASASKGYQVAIVCPTTLLVRQHFATFCDRFRETPIIVRSLSRLATPREAGETREMLKNGHADIVVGTHALLGDQVRFKRLGLVVLDEEQNFGVVQKDVLRMSWPGAHVLTLTATPIPRTLRLSLIGIRDISMISTPPADRLAIRTYFGEFDGVTAREALLRERFRGGQSLIIVPRITDIGTMARFLRKYVPEVGFVEAHGRLNAKDLDTRMNGFYDRRYDVLVATTIATSGLDIPSANTLIIFRPDLFGLAQLYQIRGRVGRSNVRAYAYFMTKRGARLLPSAERRIRVISSLDSLGAGLSLASQDLDMRGGGNLLGAEQSGDMREVGVELYRSMLADEITRLKNGDVESEHDAPSTWQPTIRLGVPVIIPERYIEDRDLRMSLYRRIATLSGHSEIDEMAAELVDRFGSLPNEVKFLLRIVRIKEISRQAGIDVFEADEEGVMIRFRNDRVPSPDGLIAYLKSQGGLARIRNNRLVIKRDWSKRNDRVKGALVVCRDVARAIARPEAEKDVAA